MPANMTPCPKCGGNLPMPLSGEVVGCPCGATLHGPKRTKSILDGMPIGTTSSLKQVLAKGSEPTALEVVSSCPRCGAPIYGPKVATSKPVVTFSCFCRMNFNEGLNSKTK